MTHERRLDKALKRDLLGRDEAVGPVDPARQALEGAAITEVLTRTAAGPVVSQAHELVASSLPYIVVYQVSADAVHVARILHAAQEWRCETALRQRGRTRSL